MEENEKVKVDVIVVGGTACVQPAALGFQRKFRVIGVGALLRELAFGRLDPVFRHFLSRVLSAGDAHGL